MKSPSGAGAPRTIARNRERNDIGQATSAGAETPSFGELADYAENAKVSSRLRGQASYYADSLSGNKMAGGKVYHPEDAIAAHRTLPFGTKLRVRCKATEKSVVVSVEDRGPFGNRRRILDLSRAAAERLGMIRQGVADVEVDVLK